MISEINEVEYLNMVQFRIWEWIFWPDAKWLISSLTSSLAQIVNLAQYSAIVCYLLLPKFTAISDRMEFGR